MKQQTWRRPSRVWAAILCALLFIQLLPISADATAPITSEEVTITDFHSFEGSQEEITEGPLSAPEEQGGDYAVASFYNWNDDKIPLYEVAVEEGGYAEYVGEEPTRTGYVFTGWSPDPESTQVFNDTRFTAQFRPEAQKDYQVIIYYAFEDGSPAAGSHTVLLALGETYQVASPSVEGFTPDAMNVSGIIDAQSEPVTS
ncbi:MAG: hypothetical protein FWG37_06085, partial [Clostridia bacterium]|nr:hypothetical protein [Clostridia bacterium]